MDSHQKYESDMTTATALLPPEFRHHWVKRLAEMMSVPLDTARHWAFRRMPDARRREIAQALVAECTRLETMIADTRRRWTEIANEASGTVAGGSADQARPEARRMGGAMKR